MTMHMMGAVAELPPSPRIRIIREGLARERSHRMLGFKGADRDGKVAEVDTWLEHLSHIEVALQKAKGVVQHHKEVRARLRACVERHGLKASDDEPDQVVIAALDGWAERS